MYRQVTPSIYHVSKLHPMTILKRYIPEKTQEELSIWYTYFDFRFHKILFGCEAPKFEKSCVSVSSFKYLRHLKEKVLTVCLCKDQAKMIQQINQKNLHYKNLDELLIIFYCKHISFSVLRNSAVTARYSSLLKIAHRFTVSLSTCQCDTQNEYPEKAQCIDLSFTQSAVLPEKNKKLLSENSV